MLTHHMVDVFAKLTTLKGLPEINNSWSVMELSRYRLFINLFLAVYGILLNCSLTEGECGHHLSTSSGTIESPNYPKPYPAGQQCTWTVSVDGSVETIRISFSAFKLEPKSTSGQCMDYVAIYSLLINKDKDAKMEGKFCGHSKPLAMKIARSSLTVQFISNSESVSDSQNTGFSLHYQANFKNASKLSQTTVGVIAATFCAVVFIGVAILRCIMIGVCNTCNAPNPQHGDRQVLGTSESYSFRADFPPSYSTVISHPDRFPSPESSPRLVELRNGTTGAGNSHMPNMAGGPIFDLQSTSSESADDDDDDSPPPSYPGNVSEDQAGVNISDTNTTNRVSGSGELNVEAGTNGDDITAFHEVPSVAVIMADEQIPSEGGREDPLADLPLASRPINFETANSVHRDEGVDMFSQTVGSGNSELIPSPAAEAEHPLLDHPILSESNLGDTDRVEELEHQVNREEFTTI